MADVEVIRVSGLKEFQAKLRVMDAKAPRQIRLVLNDSAGIVVDRVRPLVPKRSGRASASVRAVSQQQKGVVKAGGSRAVYYPWLDFGGGVGRRNSVRKPYIAKGRYLYPTYERVRPAVIVSMETGLDRLIRQSGLG